MPTFAHSKNSAIFLGAHDLSTQLRSTSIARSTDTGETTAFQSTNKTYVLGTATGTAELDGMFAYDHSSAKAIAEVLEDYAALETAIPFAISFGEIPVVGTVLQAGIGHLSSVAYSGSVSDIVGMTASMQLSDTAGRTRSLQNPATTINTTGVTVAGTGVDYSSLRIGDTDGGGDDVANTNFPVGGIACYHILSNTVNAETTIVLQSRDGAAAWVDIGTAQSFASATTGYAHQIVTTAVDDEIRWNIVTTGTGALKILAYFIPKSSI
jgi:hypothetical protein